MHTYLSISNFIDKKQEMLMISSTHINQYIYIAQIQHRKRRQRMDDPRATKILTSKDQQEINQTLMQLQNNQHVNAFFVLSKFIDCNDIKNQPQFTEILFHDHIDVIIQLIEWMLMPKVIIKKKKIKANVDSYPYQCREFLKDNWTFYQQMYIASRNKKFQFGLWFNFLRKQYFDKETIYTALGYFADVMIPFAKYQFSGSFNLTKSLEVNTSSKNQETLSIMKILPQILIDQLIKYCHYQPIYTFLKTSILVSIDDPRDYQISKQAAYKLINSSKIQNIFGKFPIQSTAANQQLSKGIQYLQNISNSFKQMTQNIQPSNNDVSFRSGAMIDSILNSKIVQYSVEELKKSRLCGVKDKEKEKEKDRLHSSFDQLNTTNPDLNVSYNLLNLFISTQIPQSVNLNLFPSVGSLPFITDADQEQIVQILFRILSSIVQIFIRIPRTLHVAQQSQQNHQQKKLQKLTQSQFASKFKFSKQKPRQLTYAQYSYITLQFRDQMQYLLDNLQILSKFVYNENQTSMPGINTNTRIIPFASGQNVKAITMMKLQYFKLLHSCLIMIQIKDIDVYGSPLAQPSSKQKSSALKRMKSIAIQPFNIKIQKLHTLQIIKRYLNQNRWNNLAHHVLQKICHLLIVCSYDYIKKNIEKDKNNRFSDSFLAYLIQNFTKRDFVFLNTVKFTTQGNLHSIYNIAKDLAYTLNSTNQLVIFLNEFQPWKKFIMNDLKNYEDKTFPIASKPQFDDDNDNQICSIKVDEADSIKKLIDNISASKKWPTKTNKNLSKSPITRFVNSGDQFMKSETLEHMNRIYGGQRQTQGLDQLFKKKIEKSKKAKQVREFNIQGISVRKNISVDEYNSTSSVNSHKSQSPDSKQKQKQKLKSTLIENTKSMQQIQTYKISKDKSFQSVS